MNLEDHCFNAAPPGQRDAVSCVTLSMALAAIEQARQEEREACLSILRSVTPENPMTVNDCIEIIEARKP